MKVLAIRFARLGDIILLLPALGQLKASLPDSHITFVTDHRFVPLAQMCPHIDEVISVNRLDARDGSFLNAAGIIRRLVRQVREHKFDLTVDFHGFRETSLLAWLSAAPRRIGLKRFDQSYLSFCFNTPPVAEDKTVHVATMFRRVVESLGCTTPAKQPGIIVPPMLTDWAHDQLGERPNAVLYVDAPVPDRRWPPENFAALAGRLVRQIGATVAVVAGPEGRHLVDRVHALTGSTRGIHFFDGVTIPQLAALIGAADILVSNDTGPMHLGPALGVCTLGLFSVGLPEHFRPAGPQDLFLKADPIDRIELSEVLGAVEKLWTIAADRDLRR